MSKGSEIQDLANILRGEGFSDAADKLIAKLEKGEKLSRSLEKQLQAIAKKNNLELSKKLKSIRDMEKDLEDLNEEQKENLRLTKESAKELERQNKSITNYVVSQNTATKSVEKFSDMQSRTVRSVSSASDAVQRHASVLGVLDLALQGLERVFDSWFDQQQDWTRSMGEFAMRTGATANQLQTVRGHADRLRDTFSRLGGSLTGINESMQFLQDVSLAMRMSTSEMSEDMEISLLGVQRGLGLSADEAALLARTLEGGLESGNESLDDFNLNIRDFAESIGANASTISRDFLDARGTLATFGRDGGEVFRRTATFANSLGFETRRILDMFSRFDTFGTASQNINQLNAAFGTTISSFEVMTEEDPVRRIQLITDALQAQGYDMANMTRQQIRMLSDALGVSADEAARLMNGEDMAAINAETEERERHAAEMATREEHVRERILGIIEATEQRFFSIQDYIQTIVNDIADILSPLFSAMYDNADGIRDSIRDWVRSIADDPDFQNTLHDIADWIAEMPQHIREFMPTWSEIRETGEAIWPVVRQIGEIIMEVVGFAADHPEAVGVALGVLAVGQLLGGFGGIAALLSPGGVILAGIALMAAGMMETSNHASNMVSRLREVSSISDSSRTSEERDLIRRNREGALADLYLAEGSPSGASRAFAGVGNLAGDVAGFFGATDFERTIEESTSVGTYENMRTNAERALLSGASVRDVTQAIISNAIHGGRDAEINIRRAFGINESESLDSGIYSAVSSINSEVNPSPISPDAVVASSATDVAPVTSTTATTTPASATVGETRVIATNVLLDGRNVGRAFFEISRG